MTSHMDPFTQQQYRLASAPPPQSFWCATRTPTLQNRIKRDYMDCLYRCGRSWGVTSYGSGAYGVNEYGITSSAPPYHHNECRYQCGAQFATRTYNPE